METTDDRLIFVDTNILVYLSFPLSSFYERAAQKIAVLQNEGYSFWISRQVIREFVSTKSKILFEDKKYNPKEIVEDVNDLEDQFLVADENRKTTGLLLSLIETYNVIGKQIHDCNIVATMQSIGLSKILTFNVADFERYSENIEIISI